MSLPSGNLLRKISRNPWRTGQVLAESLVACKECARCLCDSPLHLCETHVQHSSMNKLSSGVRCVPAIAKGIVCGWQKIITQTAMVFTWKACVPSMRCGIAWYWKLSATENLGAQTGSTQIWWYRHLANHKGSHWFQTAGFKLIILSFVPWLWKPRTGSGQPKKRVPSIYSSWMFTWKLQGACRTSSFSLSSDNLSNILPLSSSWPFESGWTHHFLAEQALDLSKVSTGESQKGWKGKSHCHFWRNATWRWKWSWEWWWCWWWCRRHTFWSGRRFYWEWSRVAITLHGLQQLLHCCDRNQFRESYQELAHSMVTTRHHPHVVREDADGQ